jgi:hypothetical protein
MRRSAWRGAALAVAVGLAGCGIDPSGWLGGKPAPRHGPHAGRADHADARKPDPVKPAKPPGEGARGYDAPEGDPQLLLFIVVDTLRADHLSLCGYRRPTSPELERLRERGAVASCRAYSPASWTLPSHASYFTGEYVPEHGLSLAPEGALAVNPNVSIRPLAEDAVTLAEQLKEAGFQTAFLSANPIIRAETGLHQGFDHVRVADAQEGGLRGEALPNALRKLLSSLDPDKKLFLFVNIYDAHDPYPAVPTRIDWLPNRTDVRLSPTRADATNDAWRYWARKMPAKEAGAWLAHLRDSYDWGVHEADRNVGRVMEMVRELGFSDGGVRMLVTSDHGEFLGEHHLLRHGGYVHEPVVRVPFLWFDNQKQTQVSLPEPLSATEAYWLLLQGALEPEHVQARAISEPNPEFFQRGVRAVAVWDADDKGVWDEEGVRRFVLGADPEEASPQPLTDPLLGQVMSFKDAFDAMDALPVPESAAITKALETMGYLDGGATPPPTPPGP